VADSAEPELASPVAARPAPPRPPRDIRLDVVRGWLQLSIFASHAVGSFIGGWLIHASWGLSDSSEQFIFLSGFTLGSVFARKSMREGWAAASRDMLGRTWRLYRIDLIVFALFGAMVIAADGSGLFPGEIDRLGWRFVVDEPLRAVPAALTLLYQPVYMGILPLFVWCMLALPGFAALEARYGDWALAAPVGVYVAFQALSLGAPSLGPDTGIAFEPLAWQVLFMLGAWAGRRALLGGQVLPWRSEWARRGTGLAAAIIVAGIGLRLAWYDFLPWPAPFAETTAWVGKEPLALPRAIHALALAWLVAAVVPRDARWMHTVAARTMATIGRHSLHVFCFGLFLSWAASAAFRLWPDRPWLDPVVIATGVAVLALCATWRDRAAQPTGRTASAHPHPGPLPLAGEGGLSPAGGTPSPASGRGPG